MYNRCAAKVQQREQKDFIHGSDLSTDADHAWAGFDVVAEVQAVQTIGVGSEVLGCTLPTSEASGSLPAKIGRTSPQLPELTILWERMASLSRRPVWCY